MLKQSKICTCIHLQLYSFLILADIELGGGSACEIVAKGPIGCKSQRGRYARKWNKYSKICAIYRHEPRLLPHHGQNLKSVSAEDITAPSK